MPPILAILITAIYLIACCLLIWKANYFRKSGLKRSVLIGLFLLQAGASISYGIIHRERYIEGDTHRMFKSAEIVYASLSDDPRIYFRLVLGLNGVDPPEYASQTVNDLYYWPNTDSYTLVRFHALLMPISFGIYHVHAVLFAFLTFMACIALFRMLMRHFPDRQILFIISIFLIPSIVYYGSGLHKEGLVIIALSVILYNMDKLINWKGNLWRFIPLASGFFLLFLVREFYLAALLPPFLAYLWVQWKPCRMSLKFFLAIGIIWLSLFHLQYIFPDFNLAENISQKQQDFKTLDGQTNIGIRDIEPNFISVIKAIPNGLVNILFRPYPNEVSHTLLLIYAIENWILILFILLSIFFLDRRKLSEPFIALLLTFSLSAFAIIGIIIPNIGAISRYRSPALLFLILSFAILIDWNRIMSWVKRKK